MGSKQKKLKKLIALAVAIVVCLAAILIYDGVKSAKEKKEALEAAAITNQVSDFEKADIKRAIIKNSNINYTFDLSEGTWTNEISVDFLVNQDTLELIADDLTGLSCVRSLGTNIDTSAYGFDETDESISFVLLDGTERKFCLGTTNALTDDYYLLYTDADGNMHVYTVDADIEEDFSVTYDEVLSSEEMPDIILSQLVSVKVESEKYTPFTFYRSSEDSETWMIDYDGQTYECDAENVITQLNCYKTWLTTDILEYSCHDFSEYGLDSPETKITMVYYATDALGSVSDEIREFTCYFSDYNSSYCYFAKDGGTYVYTMSSLVYENKVSVSLSDILKSEDSEN